MISFQGPRGTSNETKVMINPGLEIRYLMQRYRAGHAPGARRANIPP